MDHCYNWFVGHHVKYNFENLFLKIHPVQCTHKFLAKMNLPNKFKSVLRLEIILVII